MSDPFAQWQDVQARVRYVFTVADQAYVSTLLDDASVMIRGQYPGIDADIAAGTVDLLAARAVAARMVKRIMDIGTEGVKSETAGPFGVTYDNPSGNLYLTSAERLLLVPTSTQTAISAYM